MKLTRDIIKRILSEQNQESEEFSPPDGPPYNDYYDVGLALRRIESPKNVVNLINRWKRGIISTSANISNSPTPLKFKDISKEIIQGVDWVAPLNWEEKSNKPSSIIRVELNGEIKILRK